MIRIAPFFLLSLFLYNIIGYVVVFSVRDSCNRKQMCEKLEQSISIAQIRIHKSEIRNIAFKDNGKEFWFRGELYDIKSKHIDNDFIVFNCIKDKTEKSLLAGFKKQNENNSPASKNIKKAVKDFFPVSNEIPVPVSVARELHYLFSGFNCSSCILLASPPPEIALS